MIASILGDADVAPELMRFVLQRTDGNPLFMEELIRTLLEDDSIRKQSGRYELDKTADTTKIPENIHGIIASRMDNLEDQVKRVVQLAAVIGRDFARRVLAVTCGQGGTLDASLAHLEALAFIYRKHRYPEPAYIFKHALTQEVAYESLLRRKRIFIGLGLPEDSLAYLERGVRVSNALDDHGSMTRFYSCFSIWESADSSWMIIERPCGR